MKSEGSKPNGADAGGARRSTNAEALLLREVRQFLQARRQDLEAMLAPSRELRGRLARTRSFRRVDGLDEAERDPVWDTHSALEICFERAVEELMDSLRVSLQRATLRRRARRWR